MQLPATIDNVSKPKAGGSLDEQVRIRNRRKTYLDKNPTYYSPSLELADPLLYDRMIRRFQTAEEREADGRQKGYSGVLEADLRRSEAKIAALADPRTSSVTYQRGSNGEITAEDPEDAPQDKAEGQQRWHREMTERFLRGDDDDFDYEAVDGNDEWDDRRQEERDAEDRWFTEEEPCFILDEEPSKPAGPERSSSEDERAKKAPRGETGVQDF
ncbi:MAG: hypothetical protein M1815_002322 [Lichina confinis]|nr:MAG: hypothetical protein M1815_002322 [Lichina confinis]